MRAADAGGELEKERDSMGGQLTRTCIAHASAVHTFIRNVHARGSSRAVPARWNFATQVFRPGVGESVKHLGVGVARSTVIIIAESRMAGRGVQTASGQWACDADDARQSPGEASSIAGTAKGKSRRWRRPSRRCDSRLDRHHVRFVLSRFRL